MLSVDEFSEFLVSMVKEESEKLWGSYGKHVSLVKKEEEEIKFPFQCKDIAIQLR